VARAEVDVVHLGARWGGGSIGSPRRNTTKPNRATEIVVLAGVPASRSTRAASFTFTPET
jgi:hypothetical protein